MARIRDCSGNPFCQQVVSQVIVGVTCRGELGCVSKKITAESPTPPELARVAGECPDFAFI
ncbi:MAG: hypothetical protein LBQ31_02505 [Bacteroidales bacterium]|nr:hypothetical protein [Bacteroidales bacterium]